MRGLLNIPRGHHSILVADHDRRVRQGVLRALEPEGFSVYEAEAARQVLDMARRGIFDILILEMELPDVDGPHTLRMVKDLVGPMPTIFIGQDLSKEKWMNALMAHAFALLQVPLNVQVVRRTVWDLIRRYYGPPPV